MKTSEARYDALMEAAYRMILGLEYGTETIGRRIYIVRLNERRQVEVGISCSGMAQMTSKEAHDFARAMETVSELVSMINSLRLVIDINDDDQADRERLVSVLQRYLEGRRFAGVSSVMTRDEHSLDYDKNLQKRLGIC